uniref:Uncharacterized protein n=1 Tax=virus sp. ctML55 TaxID=2827627 RepID=A0A8S5RH73_9VIRU|nr:MAG TPA: hypothetical protein [virus sp. ctML55]DAH12004.1 MAG TPA: hypothetical protein [Caudoviricetes sp.]
MILISPYPLKYIFLIIKSRRTATKTRICWKTNYIWYSSSSIA